MRKFTFFISLLFSALMIEAQVLSTFNAPDIGDTSTTQSVEAENLEEGSAGQNQSWNFANLELIGNPNTPLYLDPAGTLFEAEYPTATLAIQLSENFDDLFNYYQFDGTKFEFLGFSNPQGYTKHTVNPSTTLQIPLTYGDSYTDEYAGNTAFQDLEIYIRGTIFREMDATGTLSLPSGTFDNALRIHSINITIDSSFMDGVATVVETTAEGYTWYIPGYKFPVFGISESAQTTSFIFPNNDTITNPPIVNKRAFYSPNDLGGLCDFEIAATTPNLDNIITAGDSIEIEILTTPMQSAIQNIEWIPGNSVNCDTCSLVFASPEEDVCYIATAIDSMNCIARDTFCVVVQPTAVSTFYDDLKFQLFPNPAHDMVTYQLDSGNFDEINIFDQLGRLCLQATPLEMAQQSINLSGLKKGLYYFEGRIATEKVVKKIIKN